MITNLFIVHVQFSSIHPNSYVRTRNVFYYLLHFLAFIPTTRLYALNDSLGQTCLQCADELVNSIHGNLRKIVSPS